MKLRLMKWDKRCKNENCLFCKYYRYCYYEYYEEKEGK